MTAPRAQRTPRGRSFGLVVHQFRFDFLAYSRSRQAQFFTIALPVVFLVIFASVFGGQRTTVEAPGGRIAASLSYVPGIMTLGIIAAAFVNLVITVAAQRESGVLKRRRATPASATVIVLGRCLTVLTTAVGMSAVLAIIGWTAFHAHPPMRAAPALVLAVVVGALSFCCLGFGLAAMVHDSESAQPVTQAIVLPLYFVSGVFVPQANLPHWLADLGSAFPVRHLAAAMLIAYDPHVRGAAFAPTHLLVVAGWGAAGLMVALRRFAWSPADR